MRKAHLLQPLKAGRDETYRHILSGSMQRFTRELADTAAALNAPAPTLLSTESLDVLFRQTLQRIYG